jgi:hypothetical protein
MRDIALPACLAIFACGHSHPRRRGNEHSGRQFASCAILAKSASRLARLIKGLRWPGIADCRVGEGHGVSPVTVCDLPPKLPPQIDGSQRNATAVPGTPARIDRATLVGTWVLQTERAGNVWNTMESGPGGSRTHGVLSEADYESAARKRGDSREKSTTHASNCAYPLDHDRLSLRVRRPNRDDCPTSVVETEDKSDHDRMAKTSDS